MKRFSASFFLLAASLSAAGCTYEVHARYAAPGAGLVGLNAGGVLLPGAAAPAPVGGAVAVRATNGDSHAVAGRVVTVVTVLVRAQTPRGELRFRADGGTVSVVTGRALTSGAITGGTLLVAGEEVLGGGSSRWVLAGGEVTLAGADGCAVRSGEVFLARSDDGVWSLAGGRVELADAPAEGVSPRAETVVAGGAGVATTPPLGDTPDDGAGRAAALAPTVTAGGAHAETAVHVTVQRIGAGAGGGVVVGGELALAGAGDAGVLEVLDGQVQFTADGASCAGGAGGAGAGAVCRCVARGTLLVSVRGGRRLRVRVEGGHVVLRASGRGTSGEAFYAARGGRLEVSVAAEGDATLALAAAPEGTPTASFGSPVGGIVGGAGHAGGTGGSAPARVMLDARAMHALDTLAALMPAGSRVAVRQRSAVDLVVQTARSADAVVYDTPVVGRSLVLVVDLSYSMSDLVPEFHGRAFDRAFAPTKLDIARAELVKVLASVRPGTMVSVVGFSSDLHTLWAQPRAVDDAALEAAVRWVAQLRPLDETEPVAALRAAASMHADQVVLISDGRPTQHSASESALLGLASTIATQGGRLDTVGVGSDQAEAFLASLSVRGRGTARHW